MSGDIPDAVEQAIGWAWVEACAMLDVGQDPRSREIPELLDQYRADCARRDELERAAATPEVQRMVDALLNSPDVKGIHVAGRCEGQ